jgi:hypothetical protein
MGEDGKVRIDLNSNMFKWDEATPGRTFTSDTTRFGQTHTCEHYYNYYFRGKVELKA